MEKLMTKKEFRAESGLPDSTLRRWLKEGKIKPADVDESGNPLFKHEQIAEAKALHKPDRYGGKNSLRKAKPESADVVQSNATEPDVPNDDADETKSENVCTFAESPADAQADAPAECPTQSLEEKKPLDSSDLSADENPDLTHEQARQGAQSALGDKYVPTIEKSAYDDWCAWAEKISNGQVGFITTLVTNMKRLNVPADEREILDVIRQGDRNGFLGYLHARNVLIDSGYEKLNLFLSQEGNFYLDVAREPLTADDDAPKDISRSAQATENSSSGAETDVQEVAKTKSADVFTFAAETALKEKTLQELAAETKHFLRRAVQDVFEVGRRLIEAKSRLEYGQWKKWLAENIEINYRTAANFMAVAERFGSSKVQTFADLSYSVCVKMLSLPEGDEQAFIDAQADAGRPVETQSAREVQRNVDAWKAEKSAPVEILPAETESVKIAAIVTADVEAETLEEKSDLPASPDENPAAKKLPPVAHNFNGSTEYYTPAGYIEAARKVLGTIDLDPASSELANQTVKAETFYTADDDGLKKEWKGNIWLNPPFSNGLIGEFVDKLLSSSFNQAIVLVDNATETKWFRKLAERAVAVVFTTGRINFYRNGNLESGSPTRGQVFLYFGSAPDVFFAEFAQFGWCASPRLYEISDEQKMPPT